VCEVKKKLALGIAGASALLVAGWRIVQSESESAFSKAESEPGPAAPSSPEQPSEPSATTAGEDQGRSATRERTAPAEPPRPETVEPESTGTGPRAPEGASKADLYEIAQGLGIEGRSKMSKTDLRRAIEAEG
jgi:hypothetical protein